MDIQTKIIFVLLALVLILSIVFGLKISGVLRPEQKKLESVTEGKNTIQINNDNEIKPNYEERISYKYKLLEFFTIHLTTIGIISFVLNMVLAIGAARLYRRINMPDWTVTFQYIYPVINLIIGLGKGFIVGLIGFVIGVMSLASLCCFFDSLGMSKWWPLTIIAGIISSGIGIAQSFFTTSIWLILGIVLLIMYGCAHVISSIKLSKRFHKGILYTILLILLPGIFQPILGYQKD